MDMTLQITMRVTYKFRLLGLDDGASPSKSHLSDRNYTNYGSIDVDMTYRQLYKVTTDISLLQLYTQMESILLISRILSEFFCFS
jgi:hypothetical protein